MSNRLELEVMVFFVALINNWRYYFSSISRDISDIKPVSDERRQTFGVIVIPERITCSS